MTHPLNPHTEGVRFEMGQQNLKRMKARALTFAACHLPLSTDHVSHLSPGDLIQTKIPEKNGEMSTLSFS